MGGPTHLPPTASPSPASPWPGPPSATSARPPAAAGWPAPHWSSPSPVRARAMCRAARSSAPRHASVEILRDLARSRSIRDPSAGQAASSDCSTPRRTAVQSFVESTSDTRSSPTPRASSWSAFERKHRRGRGRGRGRQWWHWQATAPWLKTVALAALTMGGARVENARRSSSSMHGDGLPRALATVAALLLSVATAWPAMVAVLATAVAAAAVAAAATVAGAEPARQASGFVSLRGGVI
mmetsp:Transcript_27482/g.59151  ORF Transcript_27482/g.59151 Transcript_27482/m.59151 type:complete len:240 (-) Transcript_27482:79-798(-)